MRPTDSRRTGLLAALGCLLLPGCSALDALDALVPRSTYIAREGLPYGAHARQKLDLYLPPQPQPGGAPLVVFFYGGAWSRGERTDYRFVGEALASRGIALAVADYRLSPEVRWRDILQDCAAVTRWAHDHAAALGCAPGRLFVMGHSAGGYNAAMLALDPRWLAAAGLQPAQLAGWIGIAGPYDFLPIRDPDTQVAFDWPSTPPDSQPIRHVSATAPRALLLAPVADNTVDPRRSTLGLGRRLEQAGAQARVLLLERVNHATVLGALAGPLAWLAPVREEVVGFITSK
jgi:acetyl esterase/lipase